MASRPDPNRMLSAALFGTARRLAVDAGSIAEATHTLEELAAGRYDLMGQEAGLMAGYWSVAVHRVHPVELLAAGLLVVSGPVDLDEVAKWVEIGRKRGSAPPHGTAHEHTPGSSSTELFPRSTALAKSGDRPM